MARKLEAKNVSTNMMTQDDVQNMVARNATDGFDTEIYEWQMPPSLEAPVQMEELGPRIARLLGACKALRADHPESSKDVAAFRKTLQSADADFTDMATRTHPHLFIMLTNPDLTKQDLKRLSDMLHIRARHETKVDTLEMQTLQITKYFDTEFWGGAGSVQAALDNQKAALDSQTAALDSQTEALNSQTEALDKAFPSVPSKKARMGNKKSRRNNKK
jgi:2-polyprenyl-6-methoxyphenol hydroxylase-like FAD-dependent oxidoreductase